MPYATIADVQALNAKRQFTQSGDVTIADVENYLTQTAGEIDGILRGQGYSLPIPTTAVETLTTLRQFNAYGGHFHAEHAAPVSKHVERAEKLWKSALCSLRDGKLELDAPRDMAESHARAGFAASPMFTRDLML